MQINPRLDPDTTHPIVLFEDLYGEDPRAPQTQFVLDRQIAFLEQLAACGSVRAAARRVKVSHQTCYRARRNSAAFGRAWDAALVVARASAEAQLGEWALHGRREDVWYHGEIVGQRTIYSDRLILAHLARLDRLRTDERIERMAEDFDGMLRRMREAGEVVDVESRSSAQAEVSGSSAQPPEAPAFAGDREGDTWESGMGEISSSGHRSMRSMSQAGLGGEAQQSPHQSFRPEPVEGLHFTSSDGAEKKAGVQPATVLRNRQAQPGREGEGGPRIHQPCDECGGLCETPFATLTEADCQWFGNRLERMLDAVPVGEQRTPDDWSGKGPGIDEIHIEAFEFGLEKWWLIESEAELEARIAEAPEDRGDAPETGDARGDDCADDCAHGLGCVAQGRSDDTDDHAEYGADEDS